MAYDEPVGKETKREMKARQRVVRSKPPANDKQREKNIRNALDVCHGLSDYNVESTVSVGTLPKKAREERRQSIETVALDVDSNLDPLLLEFHRAGEALVDFREAENLERDYEGPENREYHLWAIGGFGFLEFVGSDWFLMQYASDPGLAVAGALIPTAITVVVSAFVTRVGREWLRPGRHSKAIAVVGATAGTLVAVIGHLGMAHGRDELITGQITSLALFDRVIAGPTDLSTESWGFLFLSALAFGLCCYEWVKSDDIYPQFGKKFRRVAAAEANVEAKLNKLRSDLQHIFRGTIDHTEAVLKRARRTANATIETVQAAFLQYGVPDPSSLDISEQSDPQLITLLRAWERAISLNKACNALGDVSLALSRRPDELEEEGEPEPVEVENLSEAVRLEEARLWLDRHRASFAIEEPTSQGSYLEEAA